MTADRSASVHSLLPERGTGERNAPAAEGFAALLGGARAASGRVGAYAASSRPAKPSVAAPEPPADSAPPPVIVADAPAPVVQEGPVAAAPAPEAPAPVPGFVLSVAVAPAAPVAAAPQPATAPAVAPPVAEAAPRAAVAASARPAAAAALRAVVPAHPAPAARAASALAAAPHPAALTAAPKPAAEAPVPQPQAPAQPPVLIRRTAPLHHVPRVTAALLHVAAERGITRARINLRPADLGGIELRLQSTAAGVSAHLVADSPEAARLLQQAGDDLRRSLEQRDVNLRSLEVSTSGEERREAQRGAWAAQQEQDAPHAYEAASARVAHTLELPGGLLVDVLA